MFTSGYVNTETILHFFIIKPTMPRPYINVFSDFPEILRSKKNSLETTHNTFRSRQPLKKQVVNPEHCRDVHREQKFAL